MTIRQAFRQAVFVLAIASVPIVAAAQLPLTDADRGVTQTASDNKVDKRIHDAVGRIDYIVDLYPEVALAEPRALLGKSHFPAYHKASGVNAVQRVEAAYGIAAHAMTSWSSLSFTAFLQPNQVERLRKDPTVKSIVPNAEVQFSFSSLTDAGGVWNDNLIGSGPDRVVSWGTMAVNAARGESNSTAWVYVVDAGIGKHQDLNVGERVNPGLGIVCGTRFGIPGLAPCTPAQFAQVISCYTHSTSVAGVIGASGVGSWGVDPHARIVSVSTYSDPTASGACLTPVQTIASIKSALDWVQSDISLHGAAGLTSVVNLSVNWTDLDASTVKADMYTLSHPTSGPGALVVQSAGNQYEDACAHAYSNTASDDGVLVVGAINTHGQPVVPLTHRIGILDRFGFWRNSLPFGQDVGSNYGACVEAWAPGDGIYMPVANPHDDTVVQDSTTVYATYGFGSGTSFAAPHIAGLAAKLIETQAIHSPSAAEAAVRAVSYALGSKDSSGLAIKLPTNNGGVPSPSHTPYGELVAYSTSTASTLLDMRVNGFRFNAEYTQLNSTLSALDGIRLEFNSYGTTPLNGCTIQRDLAPPFNGSPTTILNNGASLALTARQTWSGNGSAWVILSPCFANGMRVIN